LAVVSGILRYFSWFYYLAVSRLVAHSFNFTSDLAALKPGAASARTGFDAGAGTRRDAGVAAAGLQHSIVPEASRRLSVSAAAVLWPISLRITLAPFAKRFARLFHENKPHEIIGFAGEAIEMMTLLPNESR